MICALESSCDETAVALFDPAKGLAGEWVYSQIALHSRYGGVVPDLATREHLRHFPLLLEWARDTAGWSGVAEIAVTQGPGLAACLAMGVAAAKALVLAKGVPVVGVNHLRAHLYSPFIALHAGDPERFEPRLEALLPHLGLLVSGGNTLLCELGRDRRIRVLSTTRDDAAGEALDKGAKLLGLGYPGGPLVEREAARGDARAFSFPRGINRRGDLDFSFSGLKTSLRYQVEKMTEAQVRARRPDLCASYQEAVMDALQGKLRRALEQKSFASVGLSGGVANNARLRAVASAAAQAAGLPLLAAQPAHTGDNAGMIAFAAWADHTGVNRRAGLDLDINPGAEAGDDDPAGVQA